MDSFHTKLDLFEKLTLLVCKEGPYFPAFGLDTAHLNISILSPDAGKCGLE